MDPGGAKVDGGVGPGALGPDATADAVTGFKHGDRDASGLKGGGGGESREASADNDNVFGGGRGRGFCVSGADERCARECGCGAKDREQE